ncbi:MAG: hypothetical protein PHX65_00455, partial [Sulfurimonas sp.]|nr:hypothetical protein [Sulfurimonas sp.]
KERMLSAIFVSSEDYGTRASTLVLGHRQGGFTLQERSFDERDEAVMRMLQMAIEACKTRGKYIGICGQAPSDYPEITEFLVQNGIDSISLNPDSLLKMRQVISDMESRL